MKKTVAREFIHRHLAISQCLLLSLTAQTLRVDSHQKSTLDLRFLLFFGLLSRLFFAVNYPEEWDSIGFMRALSEYDLSRYQPHFPGYPVYIALARCIVGWIHSPAYALSIFSAICGGLSIYPFYRICKRISGREVALKAAWLFVANPLLWLSSTQVLSDAPGLLFLIWAAYFAFLGHDLARNPGQYRAWMTCGFLFGLTLGIRLSYAPWGISFLGLIFFANRPLKKVIFFALGWLAGILVWGIPFVWHVGHPQLLALGKEHLSGHFTRWGGTVFKTSISIPHLMDRGKALFQGIWVDGLGLWDFSFVMSFQNIARILATLACLALILLIFPRFKQLSLRTKMKIAVFTLPYTFWVYLGQNVLEKPRHLLPLLPVLLWALSVAATQETIPAITRYKRLALGLFLGSTLYIAFALNLIHHNELPPALQAVMYLKTYHDKPGAVVFMGPSARFFEDYPTQNLRILKQRYLGGVKVYLSRMDDFPQQIFLTSDIVHVHEKRIKLHKITSFQRSPYVYRSGSTLTLYSWDDQFF